MKRLTITLSHGRIWTAETSSGARATGASLQSCLDKLLPVAGDPLANIALADDGYDAIRGLFACIPDSGGDGNIGRGVSAG